MLECYDAFELDANCVFSTLSTEEDGTLLAYGSRTQSKAHFLLELILSPLQFEREMEKPTQTCLW